MTAAVEVLTVRRVGKGTLRAVARVRLACCIEVAGVRLLQADGGEFWLALPQTPVRRRADGSGSGWTSLVKINDPALLDRLQAAVLAAWESAR